MVEKLEPLSEDNQPPVHPDPCTLAPMVEKPEPISEDYQPPVHPDPCTLAPMNENHEPSLSPWKKYDVFLSFRGADTRRGFVSHLYHELKIVRRIETFKDDRELEIGDPIGETLLKAVEDSHFAIVVLSENYARSAWCLEELTKICQCMEDDRRILPLFYYVEPTVVRHQIGSFGDAFKNHVDSGRYNAKKMQQWREALKTVANFSGCNANEHNTDREVVKHIVESVCKRVQTIESCHIIPSREFELFEATKEAMDKVMEALNNEDVISIGVCGMAGIGKTTMVEHVAVKAKKEGTFRHVAMAVISQKPNLWQIQARLAFMLGMTLESIDECERAHTLSRKIGTEACILIILDDVWQDIKLLDIGIPSFELLKERNSKVLITTKNNDIFSRIDCQEQITMDILSAPDSWRLFEKHTGKSFEPTTKLYRVASKVAEKCGGLPIALKTVAKALGGKSLEQWKAAAKRLKASDTFHVDESIKLSYDYLDNDSKRCFLLCCLFPEDYDIRIEDLLKYRIGEGLFQQSKIQEARDSICFVVQYLKDSNLLLDGKRDRQCARMHNVIRDVGLSISLSEGGYEQFFVQAGCQLKEWPTIDAHGYYTAISLVRNNISNLPEDFEFPELKELEILLLQSSFSIEPMDRMIGIPVCLFQRLKALKVLDISQNRISLPSSSTVLTGLHTLCLDRCLSIQSNISFLGQLKELKILSMREYPHRELPKEIGQLTKLKLLDFTSESVEIVPSRVIGNLSNLEELYMQCHWADWGSSVEGSNAVGAGEETKACFEELTGLKHLHILKVFISDANLMPSIVSRHPEWKNFDICMLREWSNRQRHLDSSSSPVYSRVLTLDIRIDTLREWFVDFVVKKTQKLQYIGCPDLCNILSEYDSGRLHKLKYLSVTGPSEKLNELMSIEGIRNEPVFQNLEELHLDQLDSLETLCVGELPTESLINLRLLKVRRCPKLMKALESNFLQRLQKLENLSCEVMDGLKYVFSSEGSGLEPGTLPKLKEMRLDNLNNLIKIWNGPASCRIFDHVKVLVVLECKELKNLFTYDEADHLHNLEDLSIEACRRLERVIEASEETVRNKKVLPKLKKLALKQLSKLTRFYGSTRNATEDEENIEFPSLEHSDVQRCLSFISPARKKLDLMMRKQPRSNSFERDTGQTEMAIIRRRGEVRKERRYGHQ